jgi:general secretion pathway protein M
MWQMSKTTSRIAALGLLAAVLTLVVLWVAMPIVQRFQELVQSIEQQRGELEQYTAFAAQAASVRTLEQRRQAELARGEFLPGDNEQVIQTNLQNAVSGIAQASNIRIRSARKLSERERAPFKLAGLGINLTSDIEALQKFLHAIETARPYLFVEAASISPLGGTNPTPGARPMHEIRLDIYAVAHRREQ